VVADVAKLAVGREDYYLRELATDHETYLSGHGESPGRWYGAGAARLGLEGEASPVGFRRMFEGRHPDTGELLGRPHGRNAVPAFDLVLRPTKSVAILYGLGDAATGRATLAAHHAGVAEAVAYLDEHLGTRRGHAGREHVPGQGLLSVGFDHRTSREGDPLLHTHLVVANRTQGPDGRWTALDGRDVYRHRLAADAIYRACYQRELSRSLGVAWTAADAHGNRELQGIPEDLVRLFSKRSEQIEHAVGQLEADGRERTPRLVKWAVHATRKPKEQQRPETLYGRWREEAAGHGHDADALVRQVWPDARTGPGGVRAGGGRGVRSVGRPGRADRDRVQLRLPGRHRGGGRPAGRRRPGRARGPRGSVLCRAGGGRGRRPGAGGTPLVHPRAPRRRAAAGRRRHRSRRRADRGGLPCGGPGRPPGAPLGR
jgi:conjugative relaxase-like TrwC/TraI family protein